MLIFVATLEDAQLQSLQRFVEGAQSAPPHMIGAVRAASTLIAGGEELPAVAGDPARVGSTPRGEHLMHNFVLAAPHEPRVSSGILLVVAHCALLFGLLVAVGFGCYYHYHY